jgi:hypothetical protein
MGRRALASCGPSCSPLPPAVLTPWRVHTLRAGCARSLLGRRNVDRCLIQQQVAVRAGRRAGAAHVMRGLP